MANVSQSRGRGRSRGEQRREGPAFLDDILAMAGSLASSRRENAAAQLEGLADAMRQFSDTLPSLPTVKTYAATAADTLEDLASYVVEKELPDIIADARDFAKRHPLVTFGGSIAAGVVITQMVQSRAGTMRAAVRTRRQRQPSRGEPGPGSGKGSDEE